MLGNGNGPVGEQRTIWRGEEGLKICVGRGFVNIRNFSGIIL
jgi:hypothetical protein